MKKALLLTLLFSSFSAFASDVTVCGMVDYRDRDSNEIGLTYSKDVKVDIAKLNSGIEAQKEFHSIRIVDPSFYSLVAKRLAAMNSYTNEASAWSKGYDGVHLLACVEGTPISMSTREGIIKLNTVEMATLKLWDLDKLN